MITGRSSAELDIRAYLLEHPTSSKSKVISGTGKDKKTVYKYYESAKKDVKAQIKDKTSKVIREDL